MMFSRTRRIHVRKANTQDYRQLSDVHATAFTRGWHAAEFETMHAQKGTDIFVARERDANNDIAQSFIVVRITGEEAEILTLATEQSKKRNGFGRALLDETLRHLNSERVKKLFLEVDENNLAAVKLYTSAGFRKVGERQAYYAKEHASQANEAGNALVMRLDLR